MVDYRKKIMEISKQNQKSYFEANSISNENQKLIVKNFRNFNVKFNRFLRKDIHSINTLKVIPQLINIIWNIQESLKDKNYQEYDFEYELEKIVERIIIRMEESLSTKFNGECASYGESLLNCYLDTYITLTINKAYKEKSNMAYPAFLVNPLTGANLELDILFEGYKLAFEFQGEHHYTDSNVTNKDSIKRNLAITNNHILIPVNAYQLSHKKLSELIINSIKEQKNYSMFVNDYNPIGINRSVRNLFKVVQRMYLADRLYNKVLMWLDNKSEKYISDISEHSPVSTSTNAPRVNSDSVDITLKDFYNRIPKLRKLI